MALFNFVKTEVKKITDSLKQRLNASILDSEKEAQKIIADLEKAIASCQKILADKNAKLQDANAFLTEVTAIKNISNPK